MVPAVARLAQEKVSVNYAVAASLSDSAVISTGETFLRENSLRFHGWMFISEPYPQERRALRIVVGFAPSFFALLSF
jgi:hypothetical protein